MTLLLHSYKSKIMSNIVDFSLPNIQKIIFIQNCGNSGSMFVQSLLDNHPQIIGIPALHAVDLYTVWVKIIHAKHEGYNITYPFIQEKLDKELYKCFTPYIEENFHQMGENKDQLLFVSKQQFFDYFFAILKQSPGLTLRNLIIAVYTAYHYCFDKKIMDNSIIIYPSHSRPQSAILDIATQFEESYFLYTIREPVQNIGSLFKRIHYIKLFGQYNPVHSICSEALDTQNIHWFDYQYDTYNKIPYRDDETTKYIKLEDLHQQPQQTMQKIAHWLDIEFTPSLLESTFMGLLWHNRLQSPVANGFDTKITTQNYNKYCNRFDNYRFKLLSWRERSYFGYGNINHLDRVIMCLILPLLLFFPFKVEFNQEHFYYLFHEYIKQRLDVFETYRQQTSSIHKIVLQPLILIIFLPILLLALYIYFIYIPLHNYILARKYLLNLWYKKLFKYNHAHYVKPL